MEFRQLRYFVAIAQEGSFLRASKRLHISQPPLSTQIRDLEEELGCRLLERSNRGVALTPAGQVFLEDAEAVIARLASARTRAQQVARGETGSLAIGFVSIAAFGVLPIALKSFRNQFPKVEVQLHELTTDAQILDLRRLELDLGIGLGPVAEPDLAFRPLLEEELILAAPSNHPLVRGEGAVDLKRLANESFVLVPRDLGPGLFDLIMNRCRQAGFSPRITQHARQMQTVIGLVSCGMGFALVPSSVQNIKRPGVRYRRLRGRGTSVVLGVLQGSGGDNLLARHFIESLRQASGGQATT